MSNATSISQFLTIIGKSANPALLQGVTGQNSEKAPVFNSLLSQSLSIKNPTQNNAVAFTTPKQATTEPTSSERVAALWQIIRQQGTSDTANSLIVNLTEKGIPEDIADELVQAFNKNDLVTIIHDPKLSDQLQSIISDVINSKINPGINPGISTDSDKEQVETILKTIETFIKDTNSKLSENGLTANVADMDLEEFKEWKKQNFSDLAAFFNKPKTKIGANGEIIKILEGPSFLHDQKDTKEERIVVDIIKPTEPQDLPISFAVIQQQSMPTAAKQSMKAPNESFVPITFNQAQNANQNSDKSDGNTNGNIRSEAVKDGRIVPTTSAAGKPQINPSSNTSTGANKNTHAQNKPTTTSTSNVGVSNFNAFFTSDLNGMDSEFNLPAFEAGFKTASQSSNPLINQPSSSQPHQASQIVAASLTRMAGANGPDGETTSYRLRLDPPELGKIAIELEFKAGQKIKATISVEKPEALNLLQRDAHLLLKALQDAGFDSASNNDLDFNLSQGQNDSADGQNNKGHENGQNAHSSFDEDSDLPINETEMSLIIDPVSGQQRVNMVV